MSANIHPSRPGRYSDQPAGLSQSLHGPTHSTPIKSTSSMTEPYSSLPRSAPSARHASRIKANTTVNSIRRDLSTSLSTCEPTTKRDLSASFSAYEPTSSLPTSPSRYRSLKSYDRQRDVIGDMSTLSPGKQSKLSEYENVTIQKQRQELELMIAELRDRDNELNDMVAGHQKQLSAWDQDRQKILVLQERCSKLERELHSKNDNIRALEARLRVAESEDQNKSTALNSTQEQLAMLADQQSQTNVHLRELEEKNRSMVGSLRDSMSAIGQLEAREQELLTVLQLKDKDLSDASIHVSELSAKFKKMDTQFKDAKTGESEVRRKVTEWKNKYLDQQREVDYVKKMLHRSEQKNDNQHLEVQKLYQDVSTLKKEVTLASEREKRKDQLLELQRSKQERSDAELSNLRQLYERQQRDLSLLHLNLESTKELLHKHQIDFTGYSYQDRLSSPYRPSCAYASDSHLDTSIAHYPTSSGSGTRLDSPRSLYTPRSHTVLTHPKEEPDQSEESLSLNGDEQVPSSKASIDLSGVDNGFLDDSMEDGHLGNNMASGYLDNRPDNGHHDNSVPADLDAGVEGERCVTPDNNPPPDNPTILQAKGQADAKLTDSPATKLHRLLTESRDMVEELEKSVGAADTDDQKSEASSRQVASPVSPAGSSHQVTDNAES